MKKISVMSTMGLCFGLAMGAGVSVSAQAAPAHADSQYRSDVAACQSPGYQGDVHACMREAGAALQIREHTPASAAAMPAQNYSANAVQRCQALPGSQRDDCMRLMDDPNAQTEGSVSSGGVLRETTITVPAGQQGQ